MLRAMKEMDKGRSGRISLDNVNTVLDAVGLQLHDDKMNLVSKHLSKDDEGNVCHHELKDFIESADPEKSLAGVMVSDIVNNLDAQDEHLDRLFSNLGENENLRG